MAESMNTDRRKETGMNERTSRIDAWELSQDMSVRATCRTYRRQGSGWANSTKDTRMGIHAPKGPWAIYLADGHDYHLACFDLDAHHGKEQAIQAAQDARECARLLETCGISTLTCISGPTGGRHVWAATLEGIPAGLMASIATLMGSILNTLDPTPLLNPKTGCARPPYSPHRDGGTSTPISGELDAVLLPDSRLDQWERLERLLETLQPSHAQPVRKPAVRETQAGPAWLPGTRKPMGEHAKTLLDAPAGPGEDMSRRMWRILTTLASRHWQFEDVAALVDRPGMERARTHANNGARIPRPEHGQGSPRMILAADWHCAVNAARHMPARVKDPNEQADPTILATLKTSTCEDVWNTKGSASMRRVLTALCHYALQAGTTSIQADNRRLGIDCGMGRETARCALKRLAAQGWISLENPAQGRQADTWKINDPTTQGRAFGHGRSQMNMPPERRALTSWTKAWLALSSHDTFGHDPRLMQAGNHYADHQLDHGIPDMERLQTLTGTLDRQALKDGSLGAGERRIHAYALERLAWQWWQKELDWMKAPAALKPRRTKPGNKRPPRGTFPRMPRRPGGKADWNAMKTRITTWASI